MTLSHLFRRVLFDDVPGWAGDNHLPAFEALRRSAFQALKKPYKSGVLGVGFDAFRPAYDAARNAGVVDSGSARAFFERFFVSALIVPETGSGFVTGFYEPEVEASPVPSGKFTVPLLSRPTDLVDVDDGNRPAGMDPYLAFARQLPDGTLAEYFDRGEIERGVLAGQGLEIAWLAEPVDAFFIHVQGAARLNTTDGTTRRVTYAAKSGHRFSGPGRILADLGEIQLEKVTMQSIRAWFRANPGRVNEILWQNRSYIFFRDAEVDDPALGPVAAAKVPLTPGRSIAVDRLLHTFGTPFFIDAPKLTAFGGEPFRRLMIAQDTGSAIVGPARGDLFAGSGDAAGEIAGVVRADADFYALLPRALFGEAA